MPPDETPNRWDFSHLPGLRAVIDPADVDGVRNGLIHRIHRQALRWAARRAGEERYRSAVDFGCGVGRLAPTQLELADRVVGVDPAENMLRRARHDVDDERAIFVRPDGIPGLDPPTLVTATYVLAILPREEVVAALRDLRDRVDMSARLVLIERVIRAPGCMPRDIEPRDAGWYRDGIRQSGWEPMGARRIRRDGSLPVIANARLTPRLPSFARAPAIALLAGVERARARHGRRGEYVDLLMWARAAQ